VSVNIYRAAKRRGKYSATIHLEFKEQLLIIILQGKSERSDWFFPGRDFAKRTAGFRGNGHKLCIFCFRKPENSNKHGPSAI